MKFRHHTLLRIACAALAWLAVARAQAQVDLQVLAAQQARVEVIERASSATIAIFAAGGQGGGSGVVISPDGYALSNFHVTHAAGVAMKCGMADGKLYDAVIVGIDPTGDVALVKLLGRDDFPCAPLADSDKVRVGDWCYVIGNPFLLATDFRPSVSYGVISGVHRYQYGAGTILEYTDCLQSDAAINPGNSGGPMFDSLGQLIGINGRGSFEKRGRVNVGVGYAISINQIKNFLGHLKSGRIVDHATLGATVRSDENRRVVVDEILVDADAFRRGLSFNDEIISFAGRTISSVNAFKNILGIYPKGWRVPLVYRHRGEYVDTLVRLRGLHRETELDEIVSGQPRVDPNKAPNPRPDRNPREGRRRRETPPKPSPDQLIQAQEIPASVLPYYVEKEGFVNFYFNELNRDRVCRAFATNGDYSSLAGNWILRSEPGRGDPVTFEISDSECSIALPVGQQKIPLDGQLSTRLEPPGSGGLLVALSLWRRFLMRGKEGFTEVTYWGTAPMPGHEGLLDVIEATTSDVMCRLFFDPTTGQLVALEQFPEEDSDPCELYFYDFRDQQGRELPGRIEVRHGDIVYQFTAGKRFRYEFVPETAP